MIDTNSDGQSEVRVRFAPSPTGFLHIGGARTALFNWLYAKAKGGKFLLRIEDTDRNRNSPEAVSAILKGLKWLGLDWDGEHVSQFEQADRHVEVARLMLENGSAYKCFLTPEELKEMRAKAEELKQPFSVQSPWRDRDPSEAPDGDAFVVRLRALNEGTTVVHDQVQGDVTFPNKDLDDLILLRSDGSPTYNLAVVVDDHDMGITHIVRGVDHLTNAARQTQIFGAMNWDIPSFAHVPLIHGPDGAKLSKRHGALGVESYRDMGYLASGLRNYLVRLGWSHGDDEFFSTEQMVAWFDLDGIGKSPARFDFTKLEALNGQHIRACDDVDLVKLVEDLLPFVDGGQVISDALNSGARDQFVASMPGLKERAKTLLEVISGAAYLFAKRPLEMNTKAKKLLSDDAVAILRQLAVKLDGQREWTAGGIESTIRKFADENELKLGKIAQPLRAAITGSNVSPPIFDVMAVLGREESLARLNDSFS